MAERKENDIRAERDEYRQSLIGLTANRDIYRVMFLVANAVGIVMNFFLKFDQIGLIIFGFLEAILGIPGLIGWVRNNGKILSIQGELESLEKELARFQKIPDTVAVQPAPQQISTVFCKSCGAELIGKKMFCQSCGTKQ